MKSFSSLLSWFDKKIHAMEEVVCYLIVLGRIWRIVYLKNNCRGIISNQKKCGSIAALVEQGSVGVVC